MRVMLGGCTCSTAASSPSVIGPSRSIDASAAWRGGGELLAGGRPPAGGSGGQAGDGQAQVRGELGDLGVGGVGGVGRRRPPGESCPKFSTTN